jgi:hypothetical protein
VDEISDQKLLDALKRRQERLTSVYLSSYLLGPLVAGIAWRPLGLFAAAGLGFGVLLLSVLTVHLIARRLTRSRLDLLAFERGLHVRLSPEALRELTTRRLREVEGPRWILHLQGAVLPHGGMVSVVLRVDAKAAEMEIRASSFRSPETRLKRCSLSVSQIQGLYEQLIGDLKILESSDRFPVRDGFPCEVVVGLRDYPVRRYVCNLADPNTQIPIVKLARSLWELASPVADLPWTIGSRDRHGNIDIQKL